MHSVITFVEFENQVISATYRNLMIGAKVLLVDKDSGHELPEPLCQDRLASPQWLGSDQAARPIQAGNLLPSRAERPWGAYRAKRALLHRLIGRICVIFLGFPQGKS